MQLTERPKHKIQLTTTDTFMEATGWLGIFLLWGFTIHYYPALPAEIPIHFNLKGEADGFGNKNYIFGVPAITTLLFSAMTILNSYPHIFNYTSPITQDNALKQYTLATRIVRLLKLSLVIIFGFLQFWVFRLTI